MSKKNRGSTLILVLIAMFIILTLGLALLSASVMNINMKRVDGKAKENFYSAETALDEINVGLEELVTQQIKRAYIDLLTQYSSIHPSQREAKFSMQYLTYLNDALSEPDNPVDTSKKIKNLLDSYVMVTPKYSLETGIGVKVNPSGKPQPTLTVDMGNLKATLHDVYVAYYNGDYETIIQTDILISCPTGIDFDSFVVADSSSNLGSFAVVADKKIQFATDTSTTCSNVIGNIYAGNNGIVMKNAGTMVSLASQEIITRGDICVANRAKLYINGVGTNRIWANNLIVSQTPGMDGTKSTTMNIHGNCIIANDLILDAKRSYVKIKGTYNGFHTNKVTNETTMHNNGSAVLVNGRDSTLDLSGVSRLTVAGNASISINEYATDEGEKASKQILMGDAIAMKANQLAYLVPECCMSSNHNPVMVDDLLDEKVDLTKEKEIALLDYVSNAVPYRTVFYTLEDGKKIVYYYLNFTDDKKAAEYVMKYYEVKRKAVRDYTVVFPVNLMSMNEHAINSTAASTSFSNRTGELKVISPTKDKSELLQNENTYQALYEAVTQKLTTKSIVLSNLDTSSLVKTYIDLPLMKKEAHGLDGTVLYTSKPDALYDVQVIYNGEGKDAEVSLGEQIGTPVEIKSHRRGIIVASGDVVVRSDFTGLIIAGGEVSIQDNGSVYADEVAVNYIWNEREKALNRFFHITNADAEDPVKPSTSIEDTIDIRNLLSYKNWRKK